MSAASKKDVVDTLFYVDVTNGNMMLVAYKQKSFLNVFFQISFTKSDVISAG